MGSQLSTDYKGRNFTGSMTLANIDILNNSGIGVLHYLQSVTPRIDLGAELAYQFGPQVPGNGMAILSVVGRYNSPNNFTLSGTLSGSSAHVCYYHKGSENLQLGVEVETNLRMQESSASFGYQIDLPKANLVFRGTIDSNLIVGAVMEKKLDPLPFTLLMSGMINHTKNQSRFGLGLLIG